VIRHEVEDSRARTLFSSALARLVSTFNLCLSSFESWSFSAGRIHRSVGLACPATATSYSGRAMTSAVDPTYPPARVRAVVVQTEAVHEECIPALVHLLRTNGVDPTIYLSDRIRQNRPGFRKHFPDVAGSVRFFRLRRATHWHDLMGQLHEQEPDLLVMNTFGFEPAGAWVSAWEGRMLGVVHNPKRLWSSPSSMALVRQRRIGLVTLAPHATATLMASDPDLYGTTATITSAFPTPPRVEAAQTRGLRRVVVPGGVNFGSRDYLQVLDALGGVADRVDRTSFQVVIAGGGKDRARLEELVAKRGLEDQFFFAPLNDKGYVPGTRYYRQLLAGHFLLPLIPPMAEAFRSWKITSAIPTSLGLGVPLIVDRWTQTVYDLPAVGYPGSSMAEGLLRALTMSEDEHADLRAAVVARRERELDRACAEMGYALRSLGLPA
jgi:hypothetical protein